MGVMQQVTNRLNLDCVLHGAYQKFKTDEEKACPNCMQEKAQEKEAKLVEKAKIGQSFEKVKIQIQCNEHGPQELELPKFLAKMAHSCPKCVELQRLKDLEPGIKKIIQKTIKEAGLPENNVGKTFSSLDATKSPAQQKITGRLVQYIKDMVAAGQSEGAKNIFLTGNMGTGKTAYASALLEGVIKRSLVSKTADENDLAVKGGLTVQFISEPNLINAITATWGTGAVEKTQDLINRLSSKAILCIDDVGATVTTHAHLLDAYAAIIDERYKRNLPTIITSNLDSNDIRLAIGARSADRFMEKGRIIIANFDWSGYRTGTIGTDDIEVF